MPYYAITNANTSTTNNLTEKNVHYNHHKLLTRVAKV